MRICIAAHGFQIGGGELSPILLANALRRGGHDIVYLVVDPSEGPSGLRSRLNAEIPVFAWDAISEDVSGFFARYEIQILNTHNLSVDHRLFWAGPTSLPPLVVSLRGSYEAHPEYMSEDFLSFMSRSTGAWLYLAPDNIEPVRQRGPDASRFIQSFNACDAEPPPAQGRGEVRRTLSIPQDSFAMVLASRAVPGKGWQIAAEVARRLHAHAPRGVILALMGDGPGLRDFTELYGKEPFIRICGAVAAPSQYFSAFDLGLLPSEGEGLPRFLLECFQAGLPAISTDVGGIPAMYGADPAQWPGALVGHAAGAEAMTQAMATWAQRASREPDLRRTWVRNAGTTATRFSSDRWTEHYEEVFRRCLVAET